ncbi:unnamed protein product [Ambrosiozyma monospora]|uniref:Unnamed protein product n=1 Tax=Ambrosiozyma monospora TaxID=43982 RepID=A0A9W7DIU8_AMBMO|nr:unnamed protein product [Ambrosiozyma monospora]
MFFISDYYQASAREIKRWEAIQRSVVYSQFNETLSGMDTIKGYRAENRFLINSSLAIDKMNEAYLITLANQRWFGMTLCVLTTLLSLLVSLLCCFRVFGISAAATGLLLSYVLMITGSLVMMFNAMTKLENEMNSVERVHYYASSLPQEALYDIPERDPDPNWPQFGEIVFENVFLKYRAGLPYVLKGLNMTVRPGEKIGVCGRTGAGKSTIMLSLYRFIEPEGTILIDGVDISKIGLRKLRSKLTIIPQDPVLFSGTIRSNLDPFEQKCDDELWDALRRAHLIESNILNKVKLQTKRDETMHKFHLNQTVEDDGTNFSLGERQSLALARALVRSSKILILDEATSSVDYNTDEKIQATIASEFSPCTVFCIAHRLKTIVNYDRILVMDKGEVIEFDTPWNLFSYEEGLFRSMCDQSRITSEDFDAYI